MSYTPPGRGHFAFFYEITPRWNDNDEYGHINNAVYYEYFDTAVNAWLTTRCGHVGTLDALGVVAETSCKFLSSASFPNPLEVGIAVERLGTSSISYQVAVFPRGADLPHAVGRFVHVYVDPASRRPSAIPPEVTAAVTADLLTIESQVHG